MPRLPEAPETQNRAREILVSASADPETAARYLDAFESQHSGIAARLISSPSGLQALVAIFANSRFLSEELLQHPEWMVELTTSQELHRSVPASEMSAGLESLLPPGEPPSALTLAVFRRRQLLRVVLRDLFGLATLSEITEDI